MEAWSSAVEAPGVTLAEIARHWARVQPDRVAYTLLREGEAPDGRITYGELDRRARAIGAHLAAACGAGERAILLYPNGLEYLAAFLGCLYAGVVAVPAYPPTRHHVGRLTALVRDARPRAILGSGEVLGRVERFAAGVAELTRVPWIATDALADELAGGFVPPAIGADALAFLQYTSGSTGEPKGVMVSHANLLANARAIERLIAHPPGRTYVNWLPMYHDMGLIGNVLQGIFHGESGVLMTPLAFFERPLRWLRAMSDHRAHGSSAPNFAYDLCALRVSEEEKRELDLSGWGVALNGSEVVSAATAERFARAFASCGFRPEALSPCYGLAEATLLVTGRSGTRARAVGRGDGSDARERVSCGPPALGMQVAIVDPATRARVPDGEVGEVWVAGASVALGYFERPAETEQVFRATIAGESPDARFLRTGDLGALLDGELYVTGRIKDLIIVRGRNVSPEDVERELEQAELVGRVAGAAAFASDGQGGQDGESGEGGEALVVVCELPRALVRAAADEKQAIQAHVRRAIARGIGVEPDVVVLVRPGGIPRTSSGKVQRSACRRLFEDAELPVVARYERTLAERRAGTACADEDDVPSALDGDLQGWLRARVAALLGLEPAEVDGAALVDLGLDSLRAVELRHALAECFALDVSVKTLLETPSVADLVVTLRAGAESPAASAGPALATDGARRAAAGVPAKADAAGALSHGQQALWFVHQRDPDRAPYNVQLVLELRSAIDVAALRAVLRELVRRHPVLRTAIRDAGHGPRQEVLAESPFGLEVIDAAGWSDDRVRGEVARAGRRRFALDAGEVLLAQLFSRAASEHVLHLCVHHVAIDFWSLVVLVREFKSLYAAHAGGRSPELAAPAARYDEFVAWQRARLAAHGERDWAYWRGVLGDDLPVLDLPMDRARPSLPRFAGSSVALRLTPLLSARLRRLGRAHGATLFQTLLAAFVAFLHRESQQDDVIVGTPTSGRPDARFADVVGYFVNPVAIRTRVAPRDSFAELLARVRTSVLEALEHQDFPFSLLVERLRPDRDASRWPLYQVAFTLQTAHLDGEADLAPLALGEGGLAADWAGLAVASATLAERIESFDLKLVMAEDGDALLGSFQYDADLFERATVERFAEHFARLLQSLAARPDAPLADLDLLSEGERRHALVEWSRGEAHDAHELVHDVVRRHAADRPEAVAVAAGDEALTYGELVRRATALAQGLRSRGVGVESRVGVHLARGTELIVALLGVLEAGAAYVPLPQGDPAARTAGIARDAGVVLLLADEPERFATADESLPVLRVADVVRSVPADGPGDAAAARPAIDARNLAYVVYTSGSTGAPKGVEVPHAGLSSLVAWHLKAYGIGPRDQTALIAGLGFDAAVWEIWPALVAGATLHVASDEVRLAPERLATWLAERGVAVTFVPTPLAQAMLREPWPAGGSLRVLLTGGDRLSLAGIALPDGLRLVNHYGPTEATVVATCGDVDPHAAGAPPIGRPIGNVEAYVLDRRLAPVAVGVPGELYLGGVPLARGYRGRPGLTAERFVPHPWASVAGARLYRTGDVVRWRRDGALDFVGRRDAQVKVRGQRIELGEIEAALRERPGVRDAVVVLARSESGDERLTGYVVADPPSPDADGEGRALEAEQVGDWLELYDHAYGEATPAEQVADGAPGAPVFDVTGWRSSYDGEPIPAAEMREWLDGRLDVIGALPEAARVLEVGCGTGLLATRLAPSCAAYFATDVSAPVVERLRAWARRAGLERCAVVRGAAHEPWPEDACELDLVLLNSVVQYFPSGTYLEQVLARAVAAVRDGGRVVVGDVRHLGLQEAFESEVEVERASGGDRLRDVARRSRFRAARETELLVAPRLFHEIAARLERVIAVELRLERGRAANEMTRYRYDAVLHVGTLPPPETAVEWRDWSTIGGLDELGRLLASHRDLHSERPGDDGCVTARAVGVRDVPNARLARALAIVAMLRSDDAAARSVAELRAALAEASNPCHAVEPESLVELAAPLGLRADLLLTPAAASGRHDVLFSRPGRARAVGPAAERYSAQAWRDADAAATSSDPLRARRERHFLAELRRGLAERLPGAMVPAALVALDRLPLTPNGKVDRRALPAPETLERPLRYEAPRDATEEILARIWADVLGLERVGVHDNFFALGGDSILSIQVIGRARREGLELRPRQLFEHQTVAELARVAGLARVVDAEQGTVSGPVPLTPIQRWFGRRAVARPDHWNQALLLEVDDALDAAALDAAVRAIVAHHDALRLRWRRVDGAWRQENAPREDGVPFADLDLRDVAPEGRTRAIETACADVQRSLSLEHGPIFRVVLLRLADDVPDRLLLVGHHVAVDGVSWRIVLEDLLAAYVAVVERRAPALPRKTTSYRAWAERLTDPAVRSAALAEIERWRAPGRGAAARPLPRDRRDTANLEADARQVEAMLGRRDTERLLREVPSAYRTQIDDVLLAALARALAPWTGGAPVLVDVEGHGRDELFADVDVTRTVGWFTVQHPLVLAAGNGTLAEDLVAMKEMRRAIPRQGFGHALVREAIASGEVAPGELPSTVALPPAEIAFNYLGQVDHVLAAGSGVRLAAEDPGPLRDPASERPWLLELNAMVADGCLQVRFGYSAAVHERATVERVAGAFVTELRGLIEHCTAPGVGVPTPSDFPLAGLAADDLAALVQTSGAGIEDVLPMTPMQEALLARGELERADGTYVEQVCVELLGDVDDAALERAWTRVVERHPALRTSFWWDAAGRGFQVVHATAPLHLERLDWRRLDTAGRSARREAWLRADRTRSFDPARVPLMRLISIREADDRRLLVWTHHHALLDGWSIPLVFADVQRAYAAAVRRHDAPLPPAASVRAHAAWRVQQDAAGAEAYWRSRLGGVTGVPLPRATTPEHAGGRERRVLDAATTRGLEALARRERVTLGSVLHAAWALLLARAQATRDVVVGVTTSGRPGHLEGATDTVGLFINALPLRVSIVPAVALGELLRTVQLLGAEMREWEQVALADVVRWSGVARGAALFDTLIAVENYPVDAGLARGAGELRVGAVDYWDRTHYGATLVASPGRELRLQLGYDGHAYDAAAAARALDELVELLREMVARPEVRVAELGAGGAALVAARAASAATASFDDVELLHRRFARWVALRPDAVAVEFGAESLTYAELDALSRSLSTGLRARGTGLEHRVGLFLDRSLDLVVAIVGVLKAGAAYVPIDPGTPAERVAYILADSGVDLVLTQEERRGELPPLDVPVCTLADVSATAAAGALVSDPAVAETAEVPGESLAYVIYTSGSTGRPKGAQVEHRQMARLFAACERHYDFGPDDVWTLFHSYGFDFSVWELWGALAYGGRLVVVPYWVSRDPDAFHELLAERGVTVLSQTPSAFAPLQAVDASRRRPLALRWIVFGGEALDATAVRGWLARHGDERPRLANMYGITETTVHVTHHALDDALPSSGPSPIGRGLADLDTWVLDAEMRPVPDGFAGELYVGGAGLCRGYLGRPGLTAERFVPHPWSRSAGARLYRTGDVVRRRADGTLEYVGRRDEQVKVRGHRIELGEIAAVLRGVAGVRETAVVLREDAPGERQLVAYVVLAAPVARDEAHDRHAGMAAGAAWALATTAPLEQHTQAVAEHLRGVLRATLPGYMVPAAFVVLERIPLTGNGKLDRAALPAPDRVRASSAPYAEPCDDAERELAAIWRDVLGAERVGRDDDFFALGGDSILAMQIVSRARRRGIFVSPRDVFESPTVSELAAVAGARPAVDAEQGLILGPVPRTPIQEWFAAQEVPHRVHWNQSVLLAVRVPLDRAVLAQCLTELLRHHDALRLRWSLVDSVWQQEIVDVDSSGLYAEVDLRDVPASERAQRITAACTEAQRSLDLASGPIFRAVYFDGGGDDRLFLVAHHVAVDGVSWRVLIDDLATAYFQLSMGEAVGLPPKTTSFREWALRLRDLASSREIAAEASYWLEQPWAEAVPLPVDHAAARNDEASARQVVFVLDEDETRALLNDVPPAYHTHIDDALLAALGRTLASWAGGDVVVDVEGHGRADLFSDVDLLRTVGWFTAQHPMLLGSTGDGIGADLVAVKEARRAVPRDGIGFGLLRHLSALPEAGAVRRLPAAQISFNYLGRLDRVLPGSDDLAAATEPHGAMRDPAAPRAYLIDVLLQVVEGRLEVIWIHGAHVHDAATVARLAAQYVAELRDLIEHCLAPDAGAIAASDFPLATGLDETALRAILDQLED